MSNTDLKFQGPNWDNSQEYQSFNSAAVQTDRERCLQLIDEISQDSKHLESDIKNWAQDGPPSPNSPALEAAIRISCAKSQLRVLVSDLTVFAKCALSVDGSLEEAKTLLGHAQQLQAQADACFQAHKLWLTLAPASVIEQYLGHDEVKADRFFIRNLRLQRDFTLSLAEEELLKNLEVNGPVAWGNLYDQLSSKLTCSIDHKGEVQNLGLAQATSLLESSDPDLRQKAYRSIEAAWASQDEACAASLNALTGWRLQVYGRRSAKRPMHFLESPLQLCNMEKETLDAMIASIEDYRPVAQAALRQQAKILGLKQLGPWDLFAPCPQTTTGEERRYTFEKAIEMIQEAFATVHPEMAEFVGRMVQEKWIEGSVGKSKKPGAYCTKFLKSRTPRVYMTFNGGMKDIITLAHELGHAFHNWVMRDLPLQELNYPMTLAETASILSQTVVNRHLMSQAQSEHQKLDVLWTDAREAEAFILNIPARYDFELSLFEERSQQLLSPRKLSELMQESWKKWYGDTLSEGNQMFWASKLHFHISSLSFYNFPYSFGFLFSLGVLAQREKLGKNFYPAYVALLRDTGRMSCEELAQRHLNVDLRQKDFWRDSLNLVQEKVSEFCQLHFG